MEATHTGKPAGSIRDRGTNFMVSFCGRKRKEKDTYTCFTVEDYGTREAARAAAIAWRLEESDARGLTKNKWTIEGSVRRVELTRGQVMLLDVNDSEALRLVETWPCCATKGTGANTFYALANMKIGGRQKQVYFHSLLTGFACVDHINRNVRSLPF